MINIRGSTPVEDIAYRYKMPRIETKIEGRGNGIKTVLPNVTDVAEALNRNASEVTKFFGCELGAQTILNEADNRYIVNGAHEMRDVQELVFKYCELFVLCQRCHLPETVIKIKKDGDIYQKCAACGAKEMVDMSHKLCTFMIKNNKSAQREASKSSKRDKKARRERAESAAPDEAEGASPREKKEKKAKKDKKDKKDKKKKKKKDRGDVESADAGDDNDNEAKGEEDEDDDLDENGEDGPNDEEDGNDAETEAFSETVNTCAGFIRAWMTENDDATADTIVEHLTAIQQSEDHVEAKDKLLIFLTGLLSSNCWPADFTPQLVLAWSKQQLLPHAAVLQKLCGSDFMKAYFVGCIEHLCALRQPLLKPHFPIILKAAFEDVEVVSEDDILAWAANDFSEDTTPKGVTEEMHEELKVVASPLLRWLEVDDDDDDDDDDDEEEEDDDGDEA